ncbi:hypothetical protein MLD38_034272 [Melastoma candidum]|uniref:Uncharacterized protein n=1 Tax=Melastoma candidum TaxID=119954 RepID=A0ACB9M9D8_9MYRT|nr:hypothetical protein MLD38_034272 [Melastoma candidum]
MEMLSELVTRPKGCRKRDGPLWGCRLVEEVWSWGKLTRSWCADSLLLVPRLWRKAPEVIVVVAAESKWRSNLGLSKATGARFVRRHRPLVLPGRRQRAVLVLSGGNCRDCNWMRHQRCLLAGPNSSSLGDFGTGLGGPVDGPGLGGSAGLYQEGPSLGRLVKSVIYYLFVKVGLSL